MYSVVGCSECESVKIVPGGSQTVVCNRCQAQIQMGSARVIFESDDLEAAKEARSVALAKRNGFDYLVEEIVERDVVQEDVSEQVASEALLEKEGVDVEETEEAGDVERPKTDGESKPQVRIVRDAIEFLDSPTDADVRAFAVDRGVPAEKVEEIVDRLCMEGEAMRTSEGVVRLL
ncbi:MAG: DUF5817 domain-containing protein [Halobacteriales archaeon]